MAAFTAAAVKPISRSQRNGGFGADSGPSRGGPCKGAIHPWRISVGTKISLLCFSARPPDPRRGERHKARAGGCQQVSSAHDDLPCLGVAVALTQAPPLADSPDHGAKYLLIQAGLRYVLLVALDSDYSGCLCGRRGRVGLLHLAPARPKNRQQTDARERLTDPLLLFGDLVQCRHSFTVETE